MSRRRAGAAGRGAKAIAGAPRAGGTLALVAAALVWLLGAPGAWAHGGEDHDETPVPAPAAASAPSAGGTGDVFEVLVKYAAGAPGQPLALRVFVADASSNEPVAGADVELTLSGAAGEIKATPRPTDAPGVYAATVTLPKEGDYDTVASVGKGDDADLVTLGSIHAGLPAAAAGGAAAGGPAAAASVQAWRAVALAAGALLVLVVVARVARRLRRSGGGDA